ncbi:MAG TPA: hypothetical protein VGO61_22650 [Steroidobacteraceae bacterium]|jgi:hypothetical protein|nr:hypothetical protein [Steroidobacteraceae bacterium]
MKASLTALPACATFAANVAAPARPNYHPIATAALDAGVLKPTER